MQEEEATFAQFIKSYTDKLSSQLQIEITDEIREASVVQACQATGLDSDHLLLAITYDERAHIGSDNEEGEDHDAEWEAFNPLLRYWTMFTGSNVALNTRVPFFGTLSQAECSLEKARDGLHRRTFSVNIDVA